MPETSIEGVAEGLDREAGAIRNMMQVADATPLAVAASLPAPPPMPRTRSLPIYAPVSRDIPTATGQKVADLRNVPLNPEERIVVRSAYHRMSPKDAEFEYAKQKAKLKAKAQCLRHRAWRMGCQCSRGCRGHDRDVARIDIASRAASRRL